MNNEREATFIRKAMIYMSDNDTNLETVKIEVPGKLIAVNAPPGNYSGNLFLSATREHFVITDGEGNRAVYDWEVFEDAFDFLITMRSKLPRREG